MTLPALLLTFGCSAAPAGPPQILVDRTACSHCGMLVSELVYAAAYQADGAEPKVFDDIGCLRNAARDESGPLTFWFHDGEDGARIDGTAAVFVQSPDIRSPMGGGLIAYRDRAAAERAAGTRRGRVIGSVTEMLSDARLVGARLLEGRAYGSSPTQLGKGEM